MDAKSLFRYFICFIVGSSQNPSINHNRGAHGIGIIERLDRIVRGIDAAVRSHIKIEVSSESLGLPRGVMQAVSIPQKWDPILDR